VPRSTGELKKAMESTNRDSPLRILASILILTRRDFEPRELLYASVLLVTWSAQNWMCEIIETDLENIIGQAWLDVSRHQRFKLLAPNLTSKAISEACEENSYGMRKAAGVCLAARLGVNLGLGQTDLELERIVCDGCSAKKKTE
jgi:hypothetical protein